MRYSVSYDLQAPDQNYPKLIGELERLGGKRILYSHWVVNLKDANAVTLRDHLEGFIDSNDRLMVIKLDGTNWASYQLLAKVKQI